MSLGELCSVNIFEYIEYKILIGYFMGSYKILRYSTISFWDIPNAAHWNIRGIAFVNLRQFEVFSG